MISLPADWLPAAGASDDWSPARGTLGPARGACPVHKEAVMAAEASTAWLSLSAYVERKGRPWGAAEGCTRCARRMTGEEREGQSPRARGPVGGLGTGGGRRGGSRRAGGVGPMWKPSPRLLVPAAHPGARSGPLWSVLGEVSHLRLRPASPRPCVSAPAPRFETLPGSRRNRCETPARCLVVKK